MKSALRDAFEASRQGYSADRVVADPDLNSAFFHECRLRGIESSDLELNKALLNLRKCGHLAGLKSKRTSFPNEDEYRFAAEIAARFLERKLHTSLDEIICDPAAAKELDEIAMSIAPGFAPVQYRWAALNLRKSKKLKPEILAHAVPPIEVLSFTVKGLRLDQIPANGGLYLFFARDKVLYVGEAENIRTRLKKHLDHSDRRELARWLWEFGIDDLFVEVQVLGPAATARIRRALELELIRSRQPVFNIQR